MNMNKYKALLSDLKLNFEDYSNDKSRNVAKLVLIYLSVRLLSNDKCNDGNKLTTEYLIDDNGFITLVNSLSKVNEQIKNLFTHGFETKKTLKYFDDSSKTKICNYSAQVELADIELIDQLIDLLHGGHYANDVDVIIESILKNNIPQSILTLGVRNNRFITNLTNETFIASLSYDMGRWRENLLHILFRACNKSESYLSDLTTTVYPNKSFDYAYISANSRDKQLDYDNELYKKINKKGIVSDSDRQVIANKYSLTVGELHEFIGNTNLTPYHIYQALHQLQPTGKLFLSIRLPELESTTTKQLRQQLLKNDLIESCIFVNTERVSPRVILVLTREKPQQLKQQVYFINENIYFDGLLKHKANPEIIGKICNLYNDKSTLANTAGLIAVSQLKKYNYRLNPSFLVYLNDESNNSSKIELGDIAQINRGPHLFAASIGFESVNTGFWLLTPSAINDAGDILADKLLPISEDDFLTYQAAEVAANDVLIQTRLTTVKIGLVKLQDLTERRIIINSNLYKMQIRQLGELNPVYMFLFLRSNKGSNQLLSIATGATIKSLSLKELKKLTLNIHDKATQAQLVNNYLETTISYQLAYQKYCASIQSIAEILNGAE